MINVEGDYKEIVQWLDDSGHIKGVQHSESHFGMCFGLYTLVDSVSEKGRWVMDFNRRYVEGYKVLSWNELANSHLIRF